MEEQKPILTIVIPTLNNPEGLHKTLETFYKHTHIPFRVIVVDNSGGDAVLPETHQYIHIYVKAYRNLGFAKSFNIGLLMSTTPYIGVFNDDLEFMYDGWWDGIVDTFAATSGVGAVNPLSPRNPYHTGDIVEQYPYQKNWTDADVDRIKKIFGDNGVIDGICTWATVFKREILEEVGRKEGSPIGLALLDEIFGYGSGEDYDMNRRMGIAGFRMVATKKSYVWHWWGKTKNNMPVPKNSDVSMNHSLIAGGYATMNKKWGLSLGGNPDQDPNGWDIQGRSGPKTPLNDMPYCSITEL